MAGPQFVSPGAMASNAIADFLLKQELAKMERAKQELAVRQQEEQARRADEQLNLERTRESRIAADSQANREALEQQRRFQRASTIATHGLPGIIDADTAALLEGEGFGTLLTKGPDEPGLGTPGLIQFAGGSQYQNARAAEEARLAQAREAQTAAAERAREAQAAAAERARESNETRAMIAGMSNAGREETTRLRNDLLQTQVTAAQQKATEQEEAKKRARDAARVTSGATIDVLRQLADFDDAGNATLKPGTANLFGARIPGLGMIPGTDTANAKGALDRLKGRVIVDLLNEMKNQSRTGATGFGALSGPELTLLENAASQLNSSLISDTRAAEELSRIYNMARRLYGDDAAPSAGGLRVISIEEAP